MKLFKIFLCLLMLAVLTFACVTDQRETEQKVVDTTVSYTVNVLKDILTCMQVSPGGSVTIDWKRWQTCTGQSMIKNTDIILKAWFGNTSPNPTIVDYVKSRVLINR